jgi:uracil-DNA glycosylase family 4
MTGFFNIRQTESKSRPTGKILSCASCGLYQNSEHPKIKPSGNFKKRILVIGESSSKTDDRTNSQWRDKPGELLRNTFTKFGIDLYEDCLSTNAIPCFCENNPTLDQVAQCRTRLFKIVSDTQPVLILVLGFMPLFSLIGHRWKKDLGTIEKWRGWTIPDQDLDCWVCPTYHPSFILEKDQEFQTVWEQDIEQALGMVEVKFRKFRKPKIYYIDNMEVLNQSAFYLPNNMIAFDYETTGIKPHAKGHRIICCSIATNENDVFVFMMPQTQKEREPFINLLKNPMVGKIAQNMKYEHTWSLVRLKTEVANWEWDTMIASHILDNRPDVTGLKFQTYVQFGVIDYDSEISPYLKSGSNDGNALNRIEELVKLPGGKEKLMEYCAMDSICEFRLAQLQIEKIGYDFLPF